MTQLLDLIGNTPLVELKKFDTGCCKLLVKLESQNPAGSIKDRIALAMIQDAESKGLIRPGSHLFEATAGNTGLGLALISTLKGYKLTLVIPDKMSREKIRHIKALGASVILTRSDVEKGHPEYYQDLAQRLASETPNSFYINQFGNPANPKAHENTTAVEIWEQTEQSVDAIVCGVGSGGTITGLSRFFERAKPELELVVADPQGSIIAPYVTTGQIPSEVGSWVVEGIGEDFIPDIADLSRVRKAYSINDRESCETARELLVREGILAGSSSGTLVASALRYCQEQDKPKTVVTFICDSGNKYLSKVFDNYWMMEQGFHSGKVLTGIEAMMTHRYADGGVVVLRPDETLVSAYSRMKMFDISQLPVVVDGKLLGILDEFDLLKAIHKSRDNFHKPVSNFMTKELKTLQVTDGIDDVIKMLKKGLLPLVQNKDQFLGIITRMDVVGFMRRSIDED